MTYNTENLQIEQLVSLYRRLDASIEAAGIVKGGNPCGTCNRCCHFLYRFPVSSLEIIHIRRHYPAMDHPDEFHDFLNGCLAAGNGAFARCPYCSEEGCTIHEARPMCCRLYGYSPYRPLLEGCVYIGEREKGNGLWRTLIPLFRDFVDLRRSYYESQDSDFVPRTLTDFLDRGSMLLRKGRFEDAARDFQKALSISPHDAPVHTCLGTMYESWGDLQNAFREYDRALEIDALDYGTHIRKGLLHHSQNNLEAARMHYSRALEIDPFNASAWSNLGLLHIAMSEWTEAEEAYRHALELEPHKALHHVCLGNVYYAKNDLKGTIGEMNEALKINPAEEIAWFCLGSVYEKRGKVKKAMAHYQKFLDCSGDSERKAAVAQKIGILRKRFSGSAHA